MKFKEMNIWQKYIFILGVWGLLSCIVVTILSILTAVNIDELSIQMVDRVADIISKYHVDLEVKEALLYSVIYLLFICIGGVLSATIEILTAKGRINPVILEVIAVVQICLGISNLATGNFGPVQAVVLVLLLVEVYACFTLMRQKKEANEAK